MCWPGREFERPKGSSRSPVADAGKLKMPTHLSRHPGRHLYQGKDSASVLAGLDNGWNGKP